MPASLAVWCNNINSIFIQKIPNSGTFIQFVVNPYRYQPTTTNLRNYTNRL